MINYKEGVFIRSYTQGDAKYYASFHPEVILNHQRYDTTGRYLVVLLHPSKGLETFYLNKNDDSGQWEMNEDCGAIVEDELMEWCSNQIISQLETPHP